ncbi:plasmid mobilization relaxosome protein MobC, partial [Kineococcus auxinigenes]|uniref:plasmid mobilization relaxosome protein MobC n=1 Tax=Kineococcus sp. SYSU DK028 TaxID=3383149 RepID=UPI003D7E4849
VPGVARARLVSTRLSEAEWAAWDTARAQSGRKEMGAWVREVITTHLAAEELARQKTQALAQAAAAVTEEARAAGAEVPAPVELVAAMNAALEATDASSGAGAGLAGEVRALRGELTRIGANLNQAVRLAHTHGVDPVAVGRIETAVAQVRAGVGQVRAWMAQHLPASPAAHSPGHSPGHSPTSAAGSAAAVPGGSSRRENPAADPAKPAASGQGARR